MYADNTTSCTICGKDVNNLKNHVRMSSDGDHGPQGRYPEGWSGENGDTGPSITADSDNTASTDGGRREQRGGVDLDLVDDRDQEDDQEPERLETLEWGDAPGDASDYECAECEDRLEYHQDECQCGASPMWRVAL